MQDLVMSLLGSTLTVAIIGIIVYIFRSWIIERLKLSIRHGYDLKMLEIERQKEIRLKCEIVAELLAEWIREDDKVDYYQLNKLSFQAFVWLPKELAEELSNSLAHEAGSPDVRTLIKKIRTHLQGEDDGFEAKRVVIFKKSEILDTSLGTLLCLPHQCTLAGCLTAQHYRQLQTAKHRRT